MAQPRAEVRLLSGGGGPEVDGGGQAEGALAGRELQHQLRS